MPQARTAARCASLAGQRGAADRVDAAVDAPQAPGLRARVDRAAPEPERSPAAPATPRPTGGRASSARAALDARAGLKYSMSSLAGSTQPRVRPGGAGAAHLAHCRRAQPTALGASLVARLLAPSGAWPSRRPASPPRPPTPRPAPTRTSRCTSRSTSPRATSRASSSTCRPARSARSRPRRCAPRPSSRPRRARPTRRSARRSRTRRPSRRRSPGLAVDVPGKLYNLAPVGPEPARLGIRLTPAVGDEILLQSIVTVRPATAAWTRAPTACRGPRRSAPSTSTPSTSRCSAWRAARPRASSPTRRRARSATTTVDATAYDGTQGSGSASFTPTGCDKLAFAPTLSADHRPGRQGRAAHAHDRGRVARRARPTRAPSRSRCPAGLGAAGDHAQPRLPGGPSSPRARARPTPRSAAPRPRRRRSPRRSTGPVVLVKPAASPLPELVIDLHGPIDAEAAGDRRLRGRRAPAVDARRPARHRAEPLHADPRRRPRRAAVQRARPVQRRRRARRRDLRRPERRDLDLVGDPADRGLQAAGQGHAQGPAPPPPGARAALHRAAGPAADARSA